MRLEGVAPGSTVGADRGFDDEAFVLRCGALGITPHNGGANGSKKSSAG